MNRKQLTLLLVAGVVIGLAGLLVYKKRTNSWQGAGNAGAKLIPDFPMNEVARMQIKGAQGSVNLVKSNEVWTVQERSGYPANFDEIRELIKKFWEIKVTQSEEVG